MMRNIKTWTAEELSEEIHQTEERLHWSVPYRETSPYLDSLYAERAARGGAERQPVLPPINP